MRARLTIDIQYADEMHDEDIDHLLAFAAKHLASDGFLDNHLGLVEEWKHTVEVRPDGEHIVEQCRICGCEWRCPDCDGSDKTVTAADGG
jgi:hypothetical protein